jgi:hypothetical protein
MADKAASKDFELAFLDTYHSLSKHIYLIYRGFYSTCYFVSAIFLT